MKIYHVALTLVSFAVASSHAADPIALENKIRNRDDVELRVGGRAVERRAPGAEAVVPAGWAFAPTLELGGGYTTNADTAPGGNGSGFLASTLALADTYTVDAANNIALEYDFSPTYYQRVARDDDEADHEGSVVFTHKSAEGTKFVFTLDDTHVVIDHDNALNVALASIVASRSLASGWVGGAAFTYQWRKSYVMVTNPRRDPQSVRAVPAAFLQANLATLLGVKGLPSVTASFSHFWNLARGADEDFAADRWVLKANTWKCTETDTVDSEFSSEQRRGNNLSSRFSPAARRTDRITKWKTTLVHDTARKSEHVKYVVAYENERSNYTAARYSAWTFSAFWDHDF
jgi:hypothetical protein